MTATQHLVAGAGAVCIAACVWLALGGLAGAPSLPRPVPETAPETEPAGEDAPAVLDRRPTHGVTLTGSVVDPAGAPVPGVRVALVGQQFPTGVRQVASAVSAGDGSLSFRSEIWPGSYTVSVANRDLRMRSSPKYRYESETPVPL